jgi:hypothetical protein
MRRLILTTAFVLVAGFLASAPATATAQYGFYGNYSGGGHNYQAHDRSFQPNNAAVYPAVQPYGGAYVPFAPIGGFGYYQGYGFGTGNYGPYGQAYGSGYPQGYFNGPCRPRW